jgi:hypothetical protein
LVQSQQSLWRLRVSRLLKLGRPQSPSLTSKVVGSILFIWPCLRLTWGTVVGPCPRLIGNQRLSLKFRTTRKVFKNFQRTKASSFSLNSRGAECLAARLTRRNITKTCYVSCAQKRTSSLVSSCRNEQFDSCPKTGACYQKMGEERQ